MPAVIDIDVGKRDLQQCADAIMRLRAEWLFAANRKQDIRFNDTEGRRLSFAARRDSGYASFRKYMDYVFAYAGTYSLERELKPAPLPKLQAGDVFIKGGFPGHAVLVADVAENAQTRREAVPAGAELHAGAGDARAQEPGRHGRLAVVCGGLRWRPRHARVEVRRGVAAPLALTKPAASVADGDNRQQADDNERAEPGERLYAGIRVGMRHHLIECEAESGQADRE